MNVAVVNLKDIMKYVIKILTAIACIFVTIKLCSTSGQNINSKLIKMADDKVLLELLEIDIIPKAKETKEHKLNIVDLLKTELMFVANVESKEELPKQNDEDIQTNAPTEHTESPNVEISKVAKTEEVTDRNYKPRVNTYYNTVNIDNQTKSDLTEEILKPDIEIQNSKDILIFHTHTCESYTPSEKYNYTMTGNYRTTDSNFNVVRVGRELTTCLESKGFNVRHDETYCDYPSYSGSYSRSLEVTTNLLADKTAGLVFDIHRDAVGNGDTYGPTIMINGQRVAQLMFVIGTDGGGSEHPNWQQNLKIAVKIQEKANEMYPGLFRSIIVRNSRYNQHVAAGASIIEVGATANELDECLLSMQALANVLEEVCK